MLAALLVAGATAHAQVAPNRATAALFPTDISDARALWVNPAELAGAQAVSLALGLTVGDPGSSGQLRQWTAGFDSRGVSFGYQHDVFPGGVRADTYRAGLAAGRPGIAGGIAGSLYRGDAKTTGWDAGVLYGRNRILSLGGMLANLGNPIVRGERQVTTAIPSVTLHAAAGLLALSVLGRLSADSALGYALGATLRTRGASPVAVLLRLDTNRRLQRTAWTFGFALGAHDIAGVVASAMGSPTRLSAGDLYAVSSRAATTR